MNEPLPSGHSSVEALNVSFPQLEGNRISVVMPVVYGPPAMPAMFTNCRICSALCWMSLRAIEVKMPEVCWDCIDDQVPGFAQGKLAGRG